MIKSKKKKKKKKKRKIKKEKKDEENIGYSKNFKTMKVPKKSK